VKSARQHYLDRMKQTAAQAISEGRKLTREETLQIAADSKRIKEIDENERLQHGVEDATARIDGGHADPETGGGSLAAKARQEPGFLTGTKVFTHWKAIIADAGDAAPRREGGIEPMALDSRYAFPNIPQRDLGDATRVEFLRQNARALASVSEMQMALAGSGTKPTTTVGAELASDEPIMIATVSELLPNAIVKLDAFADLVDGTLRQAYRESLDDFVVDELIAAAGTTDNTGTGLFEQLRKAVTNLQGLGFNPSLALVSPSDAETLDLSRSGGSTSTDGPFILSPAPRDTASSPLWGLKIVAAKTVTAPIVLDASAVGNLYLGAVSLASNPFEGFSSNETRFRLEGPALMVVRQGDAIHVVA
jgi:hypothetical protein